MREILLYKTILSHVRNLICTPSRLSVCIATTSEVSITNRGSRSVNNRLYMVLKCKPCHVYVWVRKKHSGADPGIFDWGGPNFGSERTVDFFCGKLLLPHTPYRQSWLHVLIPWPLTVYLSSTRTGYTLETSCSCAW